MLIHRSSARIAALVTLAGLLVFGTLAGCGGSDHETPPPPTKTTAGSGAAAAGSSVGAPLPARTAGKACAADSECGTGSCVKQLPDMTNAFGGGGAMVEAPGGYCSKSCSVSADCGEGGGCVGTQQGAAGLAGLFGAAGSTGSMNAASGKCYASCKDASECREGYRCVSSFGQAVTSASGSSGSCQPTPATDKLDDSVVGSMCSTDSDCSGGSCMTTAASPFGQFGGGTMMTYAGGYCSGRCLQDSDCGASGVCSMGFGGGTGTCMRKCESDADCGRDGYRCRASANLGGIPGQATTTTTAKQCTPGAKPLPDAVVGKACSDDSDCGSAAMSCKTQLASQFGGQATALPGGYCTQGCVDASDCGAGGVCSGAFGGIVMGNCFKACSSATDCRAGYNCGMPPSAVPNGGMIPGGMGFPGVMGLPAGTTSTATVCSTGAPAATTDQDAGAADQDAGAP
jgi:hypothetical protein